MRKQLITALLITTTATLAACLFATTSYAQSKDSDNGSKLVGTWRGESLCEGNRPACHDEKVVYRIAKPPDESDTVSITADKLVEGFPVTMGVMDFKHDSDKNTLVNEFTRGNTHGIWFLVVRGNVIEGTLRLLPEKLVVRRLAVTKDE
jgi:hypothetical protein